MNKRETVQAFVDAIQQGEFENAKSLFGSGGILSRSVCRRKQYKYGNQVICRKSIQVNDAGGIEAHCSRKPEKSPRQN